MSTASTIARGALIRNSDHSTAIMMADGSVLEVKRDHIRGLKNSFSSLNAWATSFGTTPASFNYTASQQKSNTNKLSRVFKYADEAPHWKFAKDLLDHYNTKIHTYRTIDFKALTIQITQVKITLLKLDLDPPEFHSMWQHWAHPTTVEQAREYHQLELNQMLKRCEREGDRPVHKLYFTHILNPTSSSRRVMRWCPFRITRLTRRSSLGARDMTASRSTRMAIDILSSGSSGSGSSRRSVLSFEKRFKCAKNYKAPKLTKNSKIETCSLVF